nr:putative reverse transcriptase domain-containing protein [Tanacetum cinerariifolium]
MPSWAIPLMDAYEFDPEALEAAPQSPEQAPLSPINPIKYPYDEEEEPSALTDPTSPVPDFVPLSEETKPFKTDESTITPPSPHTVIPLSHTGLCREQKMVRPHSPLPTSTKALIAEGIIPEVDMPPQKKACFTTPFCRRSRRVWLIWPPGIDRIVRSFIRVTKTHRTIEPYYGLRLGLRLWITTVHLHAEVGVLWAETKVFAAAEAKMPLKKTSMSDVTIKALIAQGVADYKANRGSRNGHDSHNSRSGRGRTPHTARVSTYKDFLNFQPLNFKSITGVTIGQDAAYGMPWKILMKMITDKYYPRSEIIKELALMCGRMLPEESDQEEKYVGGLPDMIQDRLRTRESLKITQEITKLNSSLSKGKMWPMPTLPGLVKRKSMVELYHCTPSASIITLDCALQRYYKKDFPKLKNKNRGNQSGNGKARGRAYALGGDKTNPDSNIVTGLAGYYQRFIEGFSKIDKSMTKLTQKSVKFDWGDKEEGDFQLLKQKLCSAPILALPEGTKGFIFYCDASHKGFSVMLMQREKVIAYISRQL